MKTTFSQNAWHAYETNPDFMATALGEKMFNEIESGLQDKDEEFGIANLKSPLDIFECLSRKCPTCGKVCDDKFNIEEIDENGECIACEKMRGEVNNEYEREEE